MTDIDPDIVTDEPGPEDEPQPEEPSEEGPVGGEG